MTAQDNEGDSAEKALVDYQPPMIHVIGAVTDFTFGSGGSSYDGGMSFNKKSKGP